MKKQIDYPDLPKLSIYRYENFFNIYEDESGFKFYNLLKSISVFPSNNSSVEEDYYTKPNDTWLYISHKFYNTIDLWWLVCEYNQIKDPTKKLESGTKIKVLKREYVWPVINELNRQIKQQ